MSKSESDNAKEVLSFGAREFEIPQEPQTSLDQAFACAESSDEDAQIQQFYQVFVDEIFYLLVEDEEKANFDAQTIKPLLVSIEGAQTVLIFDTEERLAEFVEQPAEFITLTGRSLVKMFVGKGVQLGLNLGVASSSMVIDAQLLDILWQDLSQDEYTLMDKQHLNDVTIHRPLNAPDILVKSLHLHLEIQRRDIKEALLVQADMVGENAQKCFILFLMFNVQHTDLTEDQRNILQQLTGAVMPYMRADDAHKVHICVLEKRDRLLGAARRYGLNFYENTQDVAVHETTDHTTKPEYLN